MTSLLETVTTSCETVMSGTQFSAFSTVGNRIYVALATSLIVWEGVITAFKGIDAARWLRTMFLICFVGTLQRFYGDGSSIWSLRHVIGGGTVELVKMLGSTGPQLFIDKITSLYSGMDAQGLFSMSLITHPLQMLITLIDILVISLLEAASLVTIAYAAVASTVIAMFGPLFIPTLLFPKTEWLFWGWLRAFLSFSLIKVVNAVLFNILYQVVANGQLTSLVADPVTSISDTAAFLVIIIACIYLITRVPTLTSALLSGHGGGDGPLGDISRVAAQAAVYAVKKS